MIHQSMRVLSFRARALLPFIVSAGVAFSGCGPMHDAGASAKAAPDSTARRDSASGNVQTVDTIKKTDSTRPRGARDTAIAVGLIKGRTAKDSFSLLAAIRSG